MVKGVTFAEGPPLSAVRVEVLRTDALGAELSIVLSEGKKREVRRLCEHVHLKVTRLQRVRFGPIVLGNLSAGAHRELTQAEIDSLYALVHLARN
jgi:23S rRNA pseudouridine2605 synthase